MALLLRNQLTLALPLSEGFKYNAPRVDVTIGGESNNMDKATRLFYDFYAMEFLHRTLGTPKEITPSKDDQKYEKPANAAKMRMAMHKHPELAASAMFTNWDDVVYPLGDVVLPEKLRKFIEEVYEQVTVEITRKLLKHLRLTLVQEFGHITDSSVCRPLYNLRQSLMNHKNSGKSLSNEDFKHMVKVHMPNMVNHIPTVKRLLVFAKKYSSMSGWNKGIDAADAIPNEPEAVKSDDDESSYYDIDKDPSVTDKAYQDIPADSETQPESEPEEPVEIPPGADYETWKDTLYDPNDPKFGFLKEELLNIPKITDINHAVSAAKLTWEDILLCYNNIAWSSAYGGIKWGAGVAAFLKLVPDAKDRNVEKMAGMVDHIFDLQHNNGALLNKGGMYVKAEDLDRRSQVTHVARYLNDVSPQIKAIILRFLKYVSGNPEVEKDIHAITDSPTKNFTPEQSQKLSQLSFYNVDSGYSRRWQAKANYKNKKKQEVQRNFVARAHENGLFSIADSMNADVRVFNTFEEMEQYIVSFLTSHIHKIQAQSLKSLYINSRAKKKLTKEQELLLLEECKMAWRAGNNYYKAHAGEPKPKLRIYLYAFTDGTFALTSNQSESNTGDAFFETFQDWNTAFAKTKEKTKEYNCIQNPDYAIAKATIEGKPLPVPPPAYSGGPAPISHQPFKPTITPISSKSLPPHSTTPDAYKVHAGINIPPKHTIRLTEEDEKVMTYAGFAPTMVGADLWYIHAKSGDSVKVYPNDVAKLIFSKKNAGASTVPIIKFTVPKLLLFVQKNYSSATSSSPIQTGVVSTPTASTATPSKVSGTKVEGLVNTKLAEAGLVWNPTNGKYEGNGDSLIINNDRSSVLYSGENPIKKFKNLPELLSYISSQEYKKKAKAITIDKEAEKQSTITLLQEALVIGKFAYQSGTWDSNGIVKDQIIYKNLDLDEVKLYNDGSSTLSTKLMNNTFVNYLQLSNFLKWYYQAPITSTFLDEEIAKFNDEINKLNDSYFTQYSTKVDKINDKIYKLNVLTPYHSYGKVVFGVYRIHQSWCIVNADEMLVHTVNSFNQMMGLLTTELMDKDSEKIESAYITPSGADYKTQENESNASLIKLNEHDNQILSNAGFVWTPQENHYYKDSSGNIISFTDTDKARYFDAEEYQNYEFNSVEAGVYFIIQKFIKGDVEGGHGETLASGNTPPTDYSKLNVFSNENYNTIGPVGEVIWIQLNEHDDARLEQIGFEWNQDHLEYIKQIVDTPELKETSNDEKIYHFEVITCFNTGKAKWGKTKKGNTAYFTDYNDDFDTVMEETKIGSISQILYFVWERHAKTPVTATPTNPTISSNVPFSGYNYAQLASMQQVPVKTTISLVDEDESTLKKLGFEKTYALPGYVYIKGTERLAFYADGTSDYQNASSVHHFKTVQEGMQFVWDLHKELQDMKKLNKESVFKDYMKKWIF